MYKTVEGKRGLVQHLQRKTNHLRKSSNGDVISLPLNLHRETIKSVARQTLVQYLLQKEVLLTNASSI
jgi:hypothetical protein